MSEQSDPTGKEFSDSLNRLAGSTEQLEKVLARVLELLAGERIKLSVDVAGMMQAVRRDFEAAQKSSKQVIEQLAQLQGLVDTSALITSSLDLDEVLDGVMDTVIKLTGAERAYLMLRDEDSGKLSIRVARNWDQQSMRQDDVFFSEGVVQMALEQGKPIVTTNAQMDTRFQNRESVIGYGLRSILCIPLLLREQRIGLLYADNRILYGIFQDSIVPLLTAFGNQAAIAIENARLFEQVKAELDKAEREVEILRLQIDRERVSKQVSDITETEYFQQLETLARNMRSQVHKDDQ